MVSLVVSVLRLCNRSTPFFLQVVYTTNDGPFSPFPLVLVLALISFPTPQSQQQR
jgi:hypothetical protein